MKRTPPSARLALLALLVTAGCDGDPARDAGVDGPDAETPRVDAGAPDPDAGEPPLDGGGAPDAGVDAGPPPPTGPALYPADRRHSPIPSDVAAGLGAIAARGPALNDDRFMKVGDSIT
ncbi:MAG: hypothetical protein H6719_38645, partial [Sandaracinaceae bacterium]|nr:hypothetical protein [Sandaracinaceae bacterium]